MIDDKGHYSFGGKWYNSHNNKAMTFDEDGNFVMDLNHEDALTSALDPNQKLYRAKLRNGEMSGWFTSEDKLKESVGEKNIGFIYDIIASELWDPELVKRGKDVDTNYVGVVEGSFKVYQDPVWSKRVQSTWLPEGKYYYKVAPNHIDDDFPCEMYNLNNEFMGYISDEELEAITGKIIIADSHNGGMYTGTSGMIGMDTGGYTGTWDSSGRLAMLHQKELVLNASDTENMLEAVKFVRDITSTIGSAIKGNVYSMLANSIGGLAVGAPWARESNDNAQPNVFNITAEFPNANSVAEIQEAILSLPNLASQYLAEHKR
jgi:hypothetical protein